MKHTKLTIAGFAAAALLALGGVAYSAPGNGAGAGQGNRSGMGPGSGSGMGMQQGGPCVQDGPGAGRRGGRDDFMGRRMMALDLSSAQVQQLQTIRANVEKDIIPKRARLDVKRIEMRELMHQASPNVRQIEAKVKEMSDLRQDIQMTKIRGRLEARGVLTPEQLEKFLDPTWRPTPQPMGRRGMMMAPGQGPAAMDDDAE